jgi:PAS domain S-box-containing protein
MTSAHEGSSLVHKTAPQHDAGQPTLQARIEAIARLGSWRLDLADGRYTASEQLLEILGIDPAAAADIGVLEVVATIIHPDDRARVAAAAAEALSGGPVPIGDFRIVRSDGAVRWLHAVGDTEQDPDGRVTGMVGYVQDVTDRLTAEATLFESEARYRRALDGMLEAVAIFGRDWVFRYVNETGARSLGRSRSEVVGTAINELLPLFNERELIVRFNRAMHTREPDHFEFPLVLPDGRSRWFEFSLEPADEGLLVLALDVTDRRVADDAVRASEARLRALVDSLRESESLFRSAFEENPEAIGVWRPEFDDRGRFVDAVHVFQSRVARERYWDGQPLEAIVGRRIFEGWPVYRDVLFEPYRRAAEAGTSVTGEVHDTLPDGRDVWADYSIFPFEGGFVHVGRDISERRRTEEALRESEAALRESEERFRVMAEHSMSGVYVIDGDAFGYANPTLARMFGYTTAELTGADPMITVHPADRALVSENIRRRLDREVGALQYEFRGLRKDGSVIPVLSFGATAELAGRSVIVGNIVDLTERYELEERLRQAQKLEAVGQLAGGIAHDFNNLLTAIEGYAGLVDASLSADDLARADLDRIRQASARAAALTRQLLAFSRRQTLEPEVVDPADVIDEILPLLSRLLGEHIVLSTRHTLDHGHVRADRTQLEQVIVNLAVNARDAMPSGGRLSIDTVGVTLTADRVAGEPERPAGAYVRITVADTGRGIEPAVQRRIFEPYFTTKEVGRGTGMGLATVYGIVRQSGGWISVESESGVGTTFRIDLPTVEEPVGEEGLAPQPPVPTAHPGSETVLLVEDEDVIRAWLRRVLVGRGYSVIDASSGAVALGLVDGDVPIDLVVTDMVMPGIQGDELVDRLRDTRPGLPAVVISGFTGDSFDTVTLFQLLQKPFDAETLLRAVREAIDTLPSQAPGS